MRGAIFDMDGLMFDTEMVWQKNWHAIADKMGVTLEDSFLMDICGSSGRDMERAVEKHYHVTDAKPIITECINQVHHDLEIEVIEKPGLHEILQWLKENDFKIAVASSSSREIIQRNLIKTNTLQYIDVYCSGQEVQHGKPAPDLFLKAASLINVPIEECYVFEDAYNGVRAGHAANAKTIMIPDRIAPNEEMEQKAYAICSSLLEALKQVKENH